MIPAPTALVLGNDRAFCCIARSAHSPQQRQRYDVSVAVTSLPLAVAFRASLLRLVTSIDSTLTLEMEIQRRLWSAE